MHSSETGDTCFRNKKRSNKAYKYIHSIIKINCTRNYEDLKLLAVRQFIGGTHHCEQRYVNALIPIVKLAIV